MGSGQRLEGPGVIIEHECIACDGPDLAPRRPESFEASAVRDLHQVAGTGLSEGLLRSGARRPRESRKVQRHAAASGDAHLCCGDEEPTFSDVMG